MNPALYQLSYVGDERGILTRDWEKAIGRLGSRSFESRVAGLESKQQESPELCSGLFFLDFDAGLAARDYLPRGMRRRAFSV